MLKIPVGGLASYGEIARMIGQLVASRAGGTAVGHNPVAFQISCHRVIRQNGTIGGYMWGAERKQAIIAWEGAQMMGLGCAPLSTERLSARDDGINDFQAKADE